MTRKQANKLRGLLADYRYWHTEYVLRGRQDTDMQDEIIDEHWRSEKALYKFIREITDAEPKVQPRATEGTESSAT